MHTRSIPVGVLSAAAGLFAASGSTAFALQSGSRTNVTVNGDVVRFVGQPPVERFGSVIVPLRGVFEKMGASVAYGGASKSILALR